MNNGSKGDISCEKHRDIYEYSSLQQFIDNLPYIVMTLLGAVIFYSGFETPFWKWVTAGVYILYGLSGAFWIMVFVCPYCHYFNTKRHLTLLSHVEPRSWEPPSFAVPIVDRPIWFTVLVVIGIAPCVSIIKPRSGWKNS